MLSGIFGLVTLTACLDMNMVHMVETISSTCKSFETTVSLFYSYAGVSTVTCFRGEESEMISLMNMDHYRLLYNPGLSLRAITCNTCYMYV